MIILIRHAQSEGNSELQTFSPHPSKFKPNSAALPQIENLDIHQTVPDHRVKLTPDGWKQVRSRRPPYLLSPKPLQFPNAHILHTKAAEAGVKLRSLLRPSDTLHFFTSPYRRTRETTAGILDALTSPNPNPSPFLRSSIKVYEEPRLREQDFGNFQPSSAAMSAMWKERANYGHFFYRIPNGESAADAYDRISGFNESLWRQFGEEDFASVCVLVTHGLMTRVFLMKWYHFSVEYFEDLRNVNHCEFVVMKLNPDSGKFLLQNQLRTWSELRRGEAEAMAQPESPIPVRKRWSDNSEQDASGFGRRQMARRQNTADLFLDDLEGSDGGTSHGSWAMTSKRKISTVKAVDVTPSDSFGGNNKDSRLDRDTSPDANRSRKPSTETRQMRTPTPPHQRMGKVGRDGGGSRSGAGSPSGYSDDHGDLDSEFRDRLESLPVRTKKSMAMALHGDFSADIELSVGARANSLGDVDDDEKDVY